MEEIGTLPFLPKGLYDYTNRIMSSIATIAKIQVTLYNVKPFMRDRMGGCPTISDRSFYFAPMHQPFRGLSEVLSILSAPKGFLSE